MSAMYVGINIPAHRGEGILGPNSRLTEGLKYYIEIFRLLWISIIAIGGGSTGLLLGDLSKIKVTIATAGLLLVLLFLVLLRRPDGYIRQIITGLKEDTDA